MEAINSKLTLCAAAVAAALLFAPGSGLSTTLGNAAAPIGPQTGIDANAGPVILAKDKGPGDIKCCGKGPGPKPPIGPGKIKSGGGGGKGGKGDHHHHHHHGWGPAIGGAIILGMGYCAAQSERCGDEYGEDTGRYWRCMRRAGCSD